MAFEALVLEAFTSAEAGTEKAARRGESNRQRTEVRQCKRAVPVFEAPTRR